MPNHYLNQCWHIVNWTLGTGFNENLIEISTILFKKTHEKMSSGKWQSFCLDLNMLNVLLTSTLRFYQYYTILLFICLLNIVLNCSQHYWKHIHKHYFEILSVCNRNCNMWAPDGNNTVQVQKQLSLIKNSFVAVQCWVLELNSLDRDDFVVENVRHIATWHACSWLKWCTRCWH